MWGLATAYATEGSRGVWDRVCANRTLGSESQSVQEFQFPDLGCDAPAPSGPLLICLEAGYRRASGVRLLSGHVAL